MLAGKRFEGFLANADSYYVRTIALTVTARNGYDEVSHSALMRERPIPARESEETRPTKFEVHKRPFCPVGGWAAFCLVLTI